MKSGVLALLRGTAAMLCLSTFLATAAALFLSRGVLPGSAIPACAMGIAAAGACFGAFLCGRSAPAARLPLCLAAALLFLALAALFHGIFFRDAALRLTRIPACTAAGALLGAVLSSAISGGGRQRR